MVSPPESEGVVATNGSRLEPPRPRLPPRPPVHSRIQVSRACYFVVVSVRVSFSYEPMGRLAIVDDFVDTADFLAFLLRSPEDEVTTYNDPTVFISRFTRGKYDLILLDLAMPNVHGLELFDMIRSLDPDVPVVAVTAQPAASERRKALDAGFAGFYLKPITDTDAFRTKMLHLANSSPSRPA